MKDCTVIAFNRTGRDLFIDFLKAYAILCVIFAHTYPYIEVVGYGLWAGMQVPLFLLIQVFHFFKENKLLNCKKIFKRILIPFLFAQLLILSFLVFKNTDKYLIINFLKNGGADQVLIILGFIFNLQFFCHYVGDL